MARITAFSAVRWTLAGSLLQRVVGFVGLGLITRILAREAEGEAIFGAFQQLVSLQMVAMVLLPIGFDQLLIREKASPEQPRYLRALRIVVWILWIAITLFTLLGHGLLADWLDMGSRGHLLWFFPVILAVQAFRWGIKPLLVSEMAFRRITAAEFLNTSTVMLGGAALLYFWRESGALYVTFAVGELIEALWLWRGRSPLNAARAFSSFADFRDLARRHRRFCSVIGIDQGVNTFSNNSPALLLGGLIGTGAVGLFGMASRLVTAPAYLLIGAVSRITLPALAGREESELQHRMLLTLRVASATIPPFLLWLVFFAPVVVTFVLGAEWTAEAAPILQWLALSLALQSLFSPISVIDVIRNRPEVTLGWNVANLAVRAAALYFAARAGLNVIGSIAIYSAASAFMWVIYGALLAGLLRAGIGRFFFAWMRYIPLWLLLAAGFGLVGQVIDESPVAAVLLSIAPAAVYILFVRVTDREVWSVLQRVAGANKPG